MKKDSSITLLPSGSSRLNLKERLPPLSPFSWIYSTKPDIRKTRPVTVSGLGLLLTWSEPSNIKLYLSIKSFLAYSV